MERLLKVFTGVKIENRDLVMVQDFFFTMPTMQQSMFVNIFAS